MADRTDRRGAGPPSFESPVTRSYPLVTDSPLTLRDRSSTTKVIVRANADSVAAGQLGARFGTSRRVGSTVICGQRPTEWMLLGPAASADDFLATLDRSGHVNIVDHTHSRALFRLTGERSTAVLEKLCSLDWSDPMTPDGAVVSASVANTTCDIVRQDTVRDPSYLIACDRSFGQYLFDAIVDAGREFDLVVTP